MCLPELCGMDTPLFGLFGRSAASARTTVRGQTQKVIAKNRESGPVSKSMVPKS